MVAIVITLVLIAAVLLVLSKGKQKTLTTGSKVSLIRSMLIDTATNRYSLSKLQLYLWMVAAISAYIYMLVSKYLVQNVWDFVDVPQSVVAVALISVSTTVASSGVKSVSGGPGSGSFEPTGSDFVTSGGDVAPERVQQLLWTLLGAPLFILLAYRTDPRTISDIQSVPDYFLQLMGVSSAGYVGGMIARGPGPKITTVTASLDSGAQPYLNLHVTGSDIQTKGATYYLTNLANIGSPALPIPANITNTSKIDSNGVATELDLSVPAPLTTSPAGGGPWQLQLTIRTADGEMAEWKF